MAIGWHRVVPGAGCAVLGMAALRVAATRLSARTNAAAAGRRRGGGSAPPPRDRDVACAKAHRKTGRRSAASGCARAGRGSCHRARGSVRTAGQDGCSLTVRLGGDVSIPVSFPWRDTIRRRVGVCAVSMAIWTCAIEARLVVLQVYMHHDLLMRADRQHERTRSVPPKRGDILDRNGRVLAYSVDVNSVYAVPSEI